MAASQFIALLESRGLLDPEIIEELHRQVEQSKGRVTPEAIAKLLVENGQLTRFQATKLVTELNEATAATRPDPSLALRGGRPIEPIPDDHDSVEDLLPNDMVQVDEVADVEVIDEPIEVIEVVDVESKRKSRRKRKVEAFRELEELPRRVVRDTTVKKKNAWESYRILGYGFIVALLLILLIPLLGWLFKGSADEAWTSAEEAYKARDYEKAAKSFGDFGKNNTSDSRVSQSKVMVGLAKIRQDAEKAADPMVALKACQEILPTIASESALNELRGDVTDTLLRISEKFVMKIESTSSIADRKTLIEKMNQQLELVRDPRYVGTQERTQNELRIKKIEEDQSRLLRDIVRGEDLAFTLVAMTSAVEAKDVSKTYESRRALLRKYPQLQSDAKLNDLLGQATGLQQSLVVAAPKSPQMNNEPATTNSANSVLLVGRKAPGLDGENGSTIYLRVEGSVVAMNAGNGKVIWRQHIGTDWTGEPKRLLAVGDSDVLVSVPEQGVLRRLAAADGSLVWEARMNGRLVSPTIDTDVILVPTVSGEVFCLDAATGQSRWGKKFPQAIDVGIGGSNSKQKRYVLGNHSNLYAISRASGQCEEVVYVGHAPSTIAVPPIWILNQLVIFENDGSDYCTMRVFSTNDDGLNIKPAQNPITLRGHVVTEPQMDGRRLAVATNLGETAILDVEPTNPKNKVFKLISLIENETSPKTTWPLMVGNDLWLASTRLIYYQVQVTSQKLNRQWLREDGDQFTNRPIKADDYVIHSRVVRGNLGVRVTAMKPGTGDPVWESDVGVPVTSLSTDGKGFVAVTAQGAVYLVDGKSFSDKQPLDPVENLGRNQRSTIFLTPFALKDSRIGLLNQAKGNQLLIIDPSKRTTSPSKILAMDLGEAFPSGEAVSVSSGAILVPLDSAQIAMIDPEKGKMIGTPFQPSIQAGERPKWLNPVLMADKQTVIVADQQRYMYKLSTGKQLRIITSQSLEKPLKGRLAIINDVVVGVSANASGDQLDFYDSNELKRIANVPVEGRFSWGPYVLESPNGNVVLALSDIDGLIGCNDAGKKLWTLPLEKVVLVGNPSLVENDCLLATTNGELIRLSMTDGSVVARVQVGEPISGPPLILPQGLLVPCDEGLILTVPVPTAQSAQSDKSGTIQ